MISWIAKNNQDRIHRCEFGQLWLHWMIEHEKRDPACFFVLFGKLYIYTCGDGCANQETTAIPNINSDCDVAPNKNIDIYPHCYNNPITYLDSASNISAGNWHENTF